MHEFPSIAITNSPLVREIMSIAHDRIIDSLYDVLNVPPETSSAGLEAVIVERIDRVRRYQVGAHESTALSALELLSQAFVLLTNDQDRKRYDDWLRQRAYRAPLFREITPPSSAEPIVAPTPPPNCPKCGKQSPPLATTCYHCGHRRVAKSTVVSTSSIAGNMPVVPVPRMAAIWGTDQRTWLDLTPEQIQSKLETQRKLRLASLLATSCWQKPVEAQGNSRQRSAGEPSARSLCYRCGRPLLAAEDAYGLRHSELTSCVEYLAMFARRFESLGRRTFQWPLQSEELRAVREMLPAVNQNRIILGCKSCTERFLTSPRIANE